MPALMIGDLTLGGWLDATFAGFDFSVFQFFGNIQNDVFTFLANFFTSFGCLAYVIAVGLIGLVLSFNKRTRRIGLTLVFTIIIGTILTNLIFKPVSYRIRPYNTLQANPDFWAWYVRAGMHCEYDYCFPSGHTVGAAETFLALFICHAASKRKAAKALCWIFPSMALCVGASRIYLMQHYATDVIAAFIIAIIASVSGYLISGGICRSADKKGDGKPAKKIPGSAVFAIAVAYLICIVIGMLTMFRFDPNVTRCAYNGDYDCQNEAVIDNDKYPPIDGEYYCKIHWKEFSKEK